MNKVVIVWIIVLASIFLLIRHKVMEYKENNQPQFTLIKNCVPAIVYTFPEGIRFSFMEPSPKGLAVYLRANGLSDQVGLKVGNGSYNDVSNSLESIKKTEVKLLGSYLKYQQAPYSWDGNARYFNVEINGKAAWISEALLFDLTHNYIAYPPPPDLKLDTYDINGIWQCFFNPDGNPHREKE